MPRNVLVSAILAGARRRVNDFVDMALGDDAELLTYVDQAYGAYYKELVKGDPWFFSKEDTAITATVAGQKLYTLPTDWLRTLHVDLLRGSKYEQLCRLPPNERNEYYQSGDPRYYHLEQQKLAFYPTPNAVKTVRHLYIPAWTPITLTSQNIDSGFGHEALLEWEVAVRLMEKEKDQEIPPGMIAARERERESLREESFMKNSVDAQIVGLGEIDRRPIAWWDEGSY